MKTELELTVAETTILFEAMKIFQERIFDVVPPFTLVKDENGLSVVIKCPTITTEDEIDTGTVDSLKKFGFEVNVEGEWATVKIDLKDFDKYFVITKFK